MKDTEISNLIDKLNEFSSERNWDQFHSPKNLAMALSVEVAELVEIYQWKTEEQSHRLHFEESDHERISDEMADIFLYLLRLSHVTQIDLVAAAKKKMIKNAAKYPVKESFGVAKK